VRTANLVDFIGIISVTLRARDNARAFAKRAKIVDETRGPSAIAVGALDFVDFLGIISVTLRAPGAWLALHS
jgi:hypothetical protein